MQISIINKIEDLPLIKEDWNELFLKGDYSIFQSFDFNYYSWKHEFISEKKNQLAITLVTINESVVAIFPFYIDSNQQLRFINDMHFDFCDYEEFLWEMTSILKTKNGRKLCIDWN